MMLPLDSVIRLQEAQAEALQVAAGLLRELQDRGDRVVPSEHVTLLLGGATRFSPDLGVL